MTFANLKLKRTTPIGVGTEKAKSVRQEWDTVNDIEEDYRQRGLVARVRPATACPEIDPEVLTGPDSKQYTQMYLELLSWFTYTSELLAHVQARVLQYKNMQDILSAQARQQNIDRLSQGAKKMTKEEAEDRLLLSPEYQEVKLELQKFEQAKMLLSAKVESIERSLRVVSRQVEIRRLDIEQNKTSNNMPGRGGYGNFGVRFPQTAPVLPGKNST